MSIERPSLAAAFKPKPAQAPDRAASLAGLLAPRTPPASAPQEEEPATGADVAAATPVKRAAIAPKTRSPKPAGGAVTNIGVYLEPSTLGLLKNAARNRDMTYDELLVESFEYVTDETLMKEFGLPTRDGSGSVMPVRQQRRRGIAGIQVQMRLDRDQRDWIDAKTKAVGAPSRSAFVATVLRFHLTTAD
jgi:hypothetical protein